MTKPAGNKIGQLYLFAPPEEQPHEAMPLPMQYLGSKARIAGWILDECKEIFPRCRKFFDLFSGTGVVAVQALSKGYAVSTNDFEEYSFRILESILSTPRSCIDNLVHQLSALKDENSLLSGGRSFMRESFENERRYFNTVNKRDFLWEEYNHFSDNTPIIAGSNKEIDELRQEQQWNLFSYYYANTYFGIKQCLQLDSLRELAESQNECARKHLLAATVSAMTFGVSSTTHLAQYFRPSSRLGTLQLIKRRQFDFISAVQKRLVLLKHFDLPKQVIKTYKLDYLSALKRESLDDTWIVYADPPYFKEHYSRYYHVLNTFCLYDYPYLTINPMTKRVTQGRYRMNRNVSDFGKKSSVKDAFLKLFSFCKQRNFKLVLSYADTSLVDKNMILRLAGDVGLRSVTNQTTLMHSSQGKYSNRMVTEYLFCFEGDDN